MRLFNASDMTDGFGGSYNHFSLIMLATTWCIDTIGNEGSPKRMFSERLICAQAMESTDSAELWSSLAL